MVKFFLMVAADFENIASLQPQNGIDDPSFSYLFKLRCGSCGELTKKEICVFVGETVPLPVGKGSASVIQKCKFCGSKGTVTVITGRGRPLNLILTQGGWRCPLMLFDCSGYEPVDFVLGGGWKAESLAGTIFKDIDLSGGEFAEYDEKAQCPDIISNVRASFKVA
ncbi:hypothetical protein SLA2020_006570 [Shorea laevis]